MAGALWRLVWITGASTGIGRDVALKLAARGCIVAASARSADQLAELAAQSPNIRPFPLDVTDRVAVGATVDSIERELGPIDLALLNAGVWHQMGSTEFDVAKIEQSMAVNYFGLIYALEALLPRLLDRKGGHIAMVASVAGWVGLPRAIAYAPTKAAAICLAQSLKPDLDRFGIHTTVINPGFVDTPMTKSNTFPMPFLMSVDDAANRIIAGLEKRRFHIAFPWQLVFILALARRAPYSILFYFLRKMMARQ